MRPNLSMCTSKRKIYRNGKDLYVHLIETSIYRQSKGNKAQCYKSRWYPKCCDFESIYYHYQFIPVRRQAMLMSHHSGSLGKMTMTRSPLWTSHAPARIFAVLENKRRRCMQLHPFTSSLKETINVLEIRTADDKSTEISSSLYETQLNLLPPQLIKSQYQKLRAT